MNFRTARARLAVGTGIAALTLLSTAFTGPAQAADRSAEATPNCSWGRFCVWEHTHYNGRKLMTQHDNPDLSQNGVFRHPKSAFNNSGSCDVELYGGRNYTDYIGTLKPGEGLPGPGAAGRILSSKWVGCH